MPEQQSVSELPAKRLCDSPSIKKGSPAVRNLNTSSTKVEAAQPSLSTQKIGEFLRVFTHLTHLKIVAKNTFNELFIYHDFCSQYMYVVEKAQNISEDVI
jgi:hypothetical protein